ncbi:hypothetical protein H5410_041029 [Solanum commersonii]|uniref:Uncharacterized protein n=1 Tax=Solanum commersonii TaxID=4109 RepID=A0A9J5XQF5_SOLCO|nr:hypothetical protein H5410_041029 [Solanum commersonii]
MEEKDSIINAVATDDGVDNLGMALVRKREDVVYTIVLTILEYFNMRLWYKDTFLIRVMELPEDKVEYWKAKFIYDLSPLFAERVHKVLRGSYVQNSSVYLIEFISNCYLLLILDVDYDISNQTILVETNFARPKVTTRRPIKWEEIDFPAS